MMGRKILEVAHTHDQQLALARETSKRTCTGQKFTSILPIDHDRPFYGLSESVYIPRSSSQSNHTAIAKSKPHATREHMYVSSIDRQSGVAQACAQVQYPWPGTQSHRPIIGSDTLPMALTVTVLL